MSRTNNGKTIVFMAMALSQPRCIKRVTSFKEYGFNCVVYGYDRGKYDINSYPQDVQVSHIGFLKDNEYFGKAFKVFWDIVKICKHHRKERPIYYAFGIFQALYLKLLGERYVYEISDILYAYPKFKRLLGLFKTVDKWIIHSSLATVMTSGGFYTFFNIKSSKIFVIPNKVSPSLTRPPLKIKQGNDDKLSFGFVGSLRYQTILDFASVIGENFPKYEFHFWGGLREGTMKDRVDALVNEYGNIFYHGAFRSPTDLPMLYDTFDMTVACYQISSLNEKIAEPNKLYESMFFSKPIIVSEGIYLADRVKELECGYTINANNKDLIRQFVESLKKDVVIRLSKQISQIEEVEIVNNQDDLNDYIWSIIR